MAETKRTVKRRGRGVVSFVAAVVAVVVIAVVVVVVVVAVAVVEASNCVLVKDQMVLGWGPRPFHSDAHSCRRSRRTLRSSPRAVHSGARRFVYLMVRHNCVFRSAAAAGYTTRTPSMTTSIPMVHETLLVILRIT